MNCNTIKRNLSVILLLALIACSSENLIQENFIIAEQQTKVLLEEAKPYFPNLPRTIHDNKLVSTDIYDWVSGFFPGTLWLLYDYTKKEEWKVEAQKWTALLEPIQYFYGHHDVGFMISTSFGNGYRITHDSIYKSIMVQAAKSLYKRYNPKVGLILSWNVTGGWQSQRGWQYPVIIDNMMNLQLMFDATKFTGDSTFYHCAVSHADNTMKNHYRPDYSSYHVVDYDTITGQVRHQHTAQGAAHESAWARGQAWGLYGFTTCYAETKLPRYLNQAQKIAEFIITNSRIPQDLIPYWDYDAPKIPDEPRDVSAATVTASALLTLATLTDNVQNAEKYRNYAEAILKNLSTSNYRAKVGENHGFILMHSVGSIPHNNEIDVPLNYADYYFLEALLKYKK